MKRKRSNIFGTMLAYLFTGFIAFVAIVPIWSCVVTSFKTPDEYASTSVMTLPHSFFYFVNFKEAFIKAQMGLAFFNSFLVLIVVLLISILFSSMTAFVLNRIAFPGKELLKYLFLFATLIPGIAMQVTVYQIMSTLHLLNSLVGYMILLVGTDVISIYIFMQFFDNLPVSLDEAALLDGCTYFGVFFKILFPLTKPAILTSIILKGVITYNEYYMANLYLQDKTKYQVISTCLYTFTGPMGSQYNYICAGVMISILPILIVFILFQKHIYSGLAAGAVKT